MIWLLVATHYIGWPIAFPSCAGICAWLYWTKTWWILNPLFRSAGYAPAYTIYDGGFMISIKASLMKPFVHCTDLNEQQGITYIYRIYWARVVTEITLKNLKGRYGNIYPNARTCRSRKIIPNLVLLLLCVISVRLIISISMMYGYRTVKNLYIPKHQQINK